MTIRRPLSLAALTLWLSLISQAQAHDTWTTVTPSSPALNSKPSCTVFSSHHFPAPAEDALTPDRLEKVLVMTPASQEIPADTALAQTGTHVAAVVPVNGFATKTPDGYQRGKTKKEVANPILCRNSMKFAKAVFTVGNPGGDAVSKPLGHVMELIPLKDPATLKAGDILPVKVLMDGAPAQTFVYGTYSGFSPDANTFGYTTKTNKEGIAQIRLIHDGPWLLIAKIEAPYPDPEVCDTQTWSASLTFEVEKAH